VVVAFFSSSPYYSPIFTPYSAKGVSEFSFLQTSLCFFPPSSCDVRVVMRSPTSRRFLFIRGLLSGRPSLFPFVSVRLPLCVRAPRTGSGKLSKKLGFSPVFFLDSFFFCFFFVLFFFFFLVPLSPPYRHLSRHVNPKLTPFQFTFYEFVSSPNDPFPSPHTASLSPNWFALTPPPRSLPHSISKLFLPLLIPSGWKFDLDTRVGQVVSPPFSNISSLPPFTREEVAHFFDPSS